MKLKLLFCLLLFVGVLGFGQITFYNFQDIVSPVGVNPNITSSNVTISAGTIAFQNGADDGGTRIGNSGGWNQNNFDPSAKYLEFSISSNAGFEIDFTEIRLRFGRTSAGPTRVTVQYSLDGFSTAGTTILNNAEVTSQNAGALNPFSITTGLPFDINGTLTIRIWGHNASGTGNLRFNNFRVFGTVTSACTAPADPTGTITGVLPFCDATTLTYTGTTPGGTIDYWQTSATGISTANNAANTLDVSTSGSYYVRRFNTATSCWSDGALGPYVVNLETQAVIDVQPINITAAAGNDAVFTVSSANATDYQWQERIGAGAWTNVGSNSNTLTISNLNLTQDGNQYRVLVSNDCGGVTSTTVILTVLDVCASESFTNSNAPSNGSYGDGNFVGDNGVTWTYFESRDENGDANGSGINGAALMLRRASDDSRIISSAVPGGIQDFSVKLYKGFTGAGNRQVELFVNGISQGTSTPFDNYVEQIFTVSNINITGNVVIEIRNITGSQVIIDDIQWSCYNPCIPVHSVTSFAPTEGPVGTVVTILGDDFTSSTTVDFDGIPSSEITYIDSDGNGIIDTLLAKVPVGTSTGVITVTENSCEINTSNFTIINENGSCGGLSDLIMTEIYDRTAGSLGYIEVYNGTGAPINLTNYFIRRYGDNDDFINNDYTDYLFAPEITTIANGQVVYGKISTDADTASPDFGFSNSGFSGINGADIFELRNSSGVIDVYIIPMDEIGYVARRNTNTAGPNITNTPSDWTFSRPENTSDLGVFNYVGPSSNFPSVTTSPSDFTSCSSEVIFTTVASPGNSGTLAYQWYFNDGISTSWTLVSSANLPLTTVSGESSNELTLSNGFGNYNGYQFYCFVTEDGACSTASNAAQLKIGTATWDGNNWNWNNGTAQNTLPTIDTFVIIDGDYDTNVGGFETSFSACNLSIIDGIVNVANGDYIEVFNSIDIESTPLTPRLRVQPQGSFVQVENDGTVTGNARIIKQTAPMNAWYEYTYWSAPIANAVIETVLSQTNVNRRFWFNAQNYRDSFAETNNNNAAVPGQDDIDDDGNDWTLANGTDVMVRGRGYATTLSPIAFVGGAGSQYLFNFDGVMNNGIITVPIYRNDNEMADNNWNFIGNPYPSAIDAGAFLAANTSLLNESAGALSGAIFLWSQNVAPSGTANGNENLNFAQADYAVINGSGNTAGGDGVTPNNFIPSGQGFFVAMDNTATASNIGGNIFRADVTFNNAMRVTGDNDQFFRSPNFVQPDKLWLNLTSDNGVFNQILVAYVEGATDADDGMYYDAPRNQSTGAHASLYSVIDQSDKRFAIQGKDPMGLNSAEVIPLGFSTAIESATLYTISIAQLQGDFMINETVYLKDKLKQMTHNLKESDYVFTSEVGNFNQRFEIVFNRESLGVDDALLSPSSLSIVELSNGEVQFRVADQHQIESIDIIDLLGRTIYRLKGDSHLETYNLSQLSNAAYVAKVSLSNGQTITKKAIKRL